MPQRAPQPQRPAAARGRRARGPSSSCPLPPPRTAALTELRGRASRAPGIVPGPFRSLRRPQRHGHGPPAEQGSGRRRAQRGQEPPQQRPHARPGRAALPAGKTRGRTGSGGAAAPLGEAAGNGPVRPWNYSSQHAPRPARRAWGGRGGHGVAARPCPSAPLPALSGGGGYGDASRCERRGLEPEIGDSSAARTRYLSEKWLPQRLA